MGKERILIGSFCKGSITAMLSGRVVHSNSEEEQQFWEVRLDSLECLSEACEGYEGTSESTTEIFLVPVAVGPILPTSAAGPP